LHIPWLSCRISIVVIEHPAEPLSFILLCFTIVKALLAPLRKGYTIVRLRISGHAPSSTLDHTQKIRAAQVRLLYEQLPWALIATIVNAAILIVVLWKAAPQFLLISWFLVTFIVASVRYGQRRAYIRCSRVSVDSRRWGRHFLFGVAANGVLWGFAGFSFFKANSDVHQISLAFVLLGMASGGAATLAPIRSAYGVFTIPALLPFGARLLTVGDEVHLSIACMLGVYITMMWMISNRFHETVTQSLLLRFDNLDLLVDLRKAKQQLELANQELAAQVAAKAQSEESLRVADRRKNEFLATLGHELRNPMAALSMGLQLAGRKSQIDPILKANLDMMDRQVSQLARLVDDLLDVGRISTGKIGLKLRPLTLAHVLANSMEEARAAIELRHHEVLVQIQPGQHGVRGDSARLTQVIANLIENAAKYTEPGGQIRLSLLHEDGAEVVRVEDNGIGIPAGELTHVFDLFSQVRILQGKSPEGLGIGLAIVRTLVELHGGTVDAASSGLGRGSTFTVRLPALEEGISTPVPEVLPQGRLKGSQSRRRVLIVDDNEDVAAALAEFLGLEGHQTWIAHDGLQAIEIVKATELDVVLMDLGMPGLDGIETAKRIRTLPGCERLRMAAITGWGQASDRARTRDAGLDWHLVKPINTTFLSKLIAKLEPMRDAQSGT
jgi:signal transduction histidine kinase/ActR/RegA family two-component response regulator